MGKLLTAAVALLGSTFMVGVALPTLAPPGGMVLPVAAAGSALSLQHVPAAQVDRLDTTQPLFADLPAGGYPHSSYIWGNCTWWVAYNRQVPPYLGDAWQWLAKAAAAGMPTSSEPSVGAIVVYRASPGYDVVHGHVALVIAVGQSWFRVSEMNFLGLAVVDERDSHWPDLYVEGFIPR
jgi:surface antigen